LELRVVGSGPETAALDGLRALPGVSVENRWLPETEVAEVISWADVLLIPYREATQSGPAAAALAANRFVIATKVGGLIEQLGHEALATLCEPNPLSLAAALRTRLDAPRIPPPPIARHPTAGWQDLAETLLRHIEQTLPVRSEAPHVAVSPS
jgi:glycosyltransferase involved in cell wall biosynthesis